MAALPTYTIEKSYLDEAEGNDVMCQVCQCDYEEGEEMKSYHAPSFPTECIDRWLQDHPTCCICKKSIVADDEEASTTATVEQQNEEQSSTEESNTTPVNAAQRTRLHRTLLHNH